MTAMNACNYHPTQSAHFQCPKCQANLCSQCVSRRRTEGYGIARDHFFCPTCNVPADMLSVGNFITPFWKRLPQFFAYPFQFKPLLLILMLSVAGVLLARVPFVQIILWVVSIKYSYAVLRNTVQGNLRPPDLSHEVLFEHAGEAFKQIGLFLVMGIVMALIFSQLGSVIGLPCLLAAVLLLPAMIILLVVGDSLVNALNPVAFVTIAYRIGWGYLLMYLFLTLLLAAPAALAGSAASFLPPRLHEFLSLAASQYYTIIAYNLMGYVILQYHEEIGYEVHADEFVDQAPVLKAESAASAEKEQDATGAILNQVEVLIKGGRMEDAVFLLRDRLRGRASDRLLCERYYNLLKITQRTSEMLPHGVAYLDLLTAANEKEAACDVYRECLSLDPQFTPNADAFFKLAGWCTENGDAKEGLGAFVRFIKSNPEHPMTPKAHFLFGKHLNEKLRDSTRAALVLKDLIHKYPAHDMAEHARGYLDQMRKAGLVAAE